MIIRKIEIEVNKINNSNEFSYNIKKKSKHITNFINRTCLSKLKFQSENFRMLVISLENRMGSPSIINNGLVIPLIYGNKTYMSLVTDDEFRSFFYQSIIDGLNQIKNSYNIPFDKILQSLDNFKKNEFINEWIFKKKRSKKPNCEAMLICNLSIEKFRLKLIVLKDNQIIFDKIILETDPDEIAYEYRFNDLVIKEDKIIVTSKYTSNLFEINTNTINL